MARYSLGFQSKVMIAVADTVSMTSNGYAAFLQGGSATMQMRVNEVYIAGESASSNPTTMAFGRDSTVGVTSYSFVICADNPAVVNSRMTSPSQRTPCALAAQTDGDRRGGANFMAGRSSRMSSGRRLAGCARAHDGR